MKRAPSGALFTAGALRDVPMTAIDCSAPPISSHRLQLLSPELMGAQIAERLRATTLRCHQPETLTRRLIPRTGASHKSFMYMDIWDWLREAEKTGRLAITQQTQTRRCRPETAKFADSLVDASCVSPATIMGPP
mgnify:CR=1 FL=1